MSAPDYVVEPDVECPDDDPNDVAFVRATATIRGQDAIEEFMACKMYPLASGIGFKGVTIGMTHVSKDWTLLPVFPVGAVSTEGASCLLAEVETEAERILGSFRLKEYDALSTVNLPNGGHLNHIFEQIGLAYAPRPLPWTEAFLAAKEKRKAEVSKKPVAKKVKTMASRAAPSKMVLLRKIGVVKMVRPSIKLRVQGTSEIELAPAKPVGVSKKLCLLDAPSSSHGHRSGGAAIAKGSEWTTRILAFDNLGDDSSPNVREAALPQENKEHLSPPPPLMPD
jgi:hypothetical protein